ncbi:MAG: hypothetical protein IT369_09000 [Candidatus Latescibacteria bacterium]|nr:hypothetical protein [Candidatus Latescibacterota bacterium]
MRVAILQQPGEGLAAYLAEILHTWGLAEYGVIDQAAAGALDPRQTPVLLCPAGAGSEGVLAFARAGGTVVACCPDEALAQACSLVVRGDLETPVWLLPSALPAPGLSGELLPVVGRVRRLEAAAGARVLGQPAAGRLQLALSGAQRPRELRLMLPARYAGAALLRVFIDGRQVDCLRGRRYGEEMVFVETGSGGMAMIEAEYGMG